MTRRGKVPPRPGQKFLHQAQSQISRPVGRPGAAPGRSYKSGQINFGVPAVIIPPWRPDASRRAEFIKLPQNDVPITIESFATLGTIPNKKESRFTFKVSTSRKPPKIPTLPAMPVMTVPSVPGQVPTLRISDPGRVPSVPGTAPALRTLGVIPLPSAQGQAVAEEDLASSDVAPAGSVCPLLGETCIGPRCQWFGVTKCVVPEIFGLVSTQRGTLSVILDALHSLLRT